MNEEAYLQRMRAIREKYGCQKSYQYLPKHHEVLYPLSQGRQQHSYFNHQQQSFSSHSPFHKEQHHFNFSNDNPNGKSIIPERKYSSVDRNKLLSERQSPSKLEKNDKFLLSRQMSEAQLKRQDNFNHFIDDLDKRISEKQKLLNQKFRENQMVLRKAQGLQPDQLKNYNSYSQIRQQQRSSRPKHHTSFTPSKAYEKSKQVSRNYNKMVENAENEVSAKLNWNRSPIQSKSRNFSLIRDTNQLISSPSIDLVSKKLEGNSATIGYNKWDPQKLQSIQHRIQSVLKQANR